MEAATSRVHEGAAAVHPAVRQQLRPAPFAVLQAPPSAQHAGLRVRCAGCWQVHPACSCLLQPCAGVLLLLLPTGCCAHLALALLVARGEKPMRLRGLLPKLSRSLAGYLLAPLKNLRQGEDESEPMVGLSPSLLASFLPLGVMMPLEEGGEWAPASTSPPRGRVAMGFRLGLMGGSPPAMRSYSAAAAAAAGDGVAAVLGSATAAAQGVCCPEGPAAGAAGQGRRVYMVRGAGLGSWAGPAAPRGQACCRHQSRCSLHPPLQPGLRRGGSRACSDSPAPTSGAAAGADGLRLAEFTRRAEAANASCWTLGPHSALQWCPDELVVMLSNGRAVSPVCWQAPTVPGSVSLQGSAGSTVGLPEWTWFVSSWFLDRVWAPVGPHQNRLEVSDARKHEGPALANARKLQQGVLPEAQLPALRPGSGTTVAHHASAQPRLKHCLASTPFQAHLGW